MTLIVTSHMSITVLFTPNADGRNVEYYRARTMHVPGDLDCIVNATSSPKLECHIVHLNETTDYTFIGIACLSDGRGCSSGIEKTAKTWELGKLL